jgi:hypothetical protein
MNPQRVFDIWKAQKSQGSVSREFPDRVMAAILRREATRVIRGRTPLQDIAAQPWARAAVLILGTLLGLVRIITTLHLILFA